MAVELFSDNGATFLLEVLLFWGPLHKHAIVRAKIFHANPFSAEKCRFLPKELLPFQMMTDYPPPATPNQTTQPPTHFFSEHFKLGSSCHLQKPLVDATCCFPSVKYVYTARSSKPPTLGLQIQASGACASALK